MSEICQNAQKVNYLGTEGKSFFQVLSKVGHWS